jgi:DNA-binding NtrC family response regulator
MDSNGTILVAEDEVTARLSLAELLSARDYRVVQAEDGSEVLSVLMHRAFDAGIVDIRMPGLDGLTLLKRAREAGIEVPVIVRTAHGDSSTVIEAMRLGAYDFISKLIDFGQLISQIDRAVTGYGMARDKA